MEKTFDAAEAEARIYADVGRRRAPSAPAPMRSARRDLLDHDPAAQRDRRAACRPRLQQHAAGHPDPLAPDARLRHALAARHRPCRHRHPAGRWRSELAANAASPRAPRWAREEFVAKVWEWKAQSGGTIVDQLKRLGASLRLVAQRLHHVRRAGRARGREAGNFHDAVLKVFVDLYDKGLIYRGKRLVNWDPHFETAISDLEVENVEVDGHMWHFKYPLAGGETYTYVEKDEDGNVALRGRARLHLDRHDPARDDAGRRRGRGSPVGRALCADRRQALRNPGRAQGAPPPDPDHHRRIPRSRLRLGRGEDHRRA